MPTASKKLHTSTTNHEEHLRARWGVPGIHWSPCLEGAHSWIQSYLWSCGSAMSWARGCQGQQSADCEVSSTPAQHLPRSIVEAHHCCQWGGGKLAPLLKILRANPTSAQHEARTLEMSLWVWDQSHYWWTMSCFLKHHVVQWVRKVRLHVELNHTL